MSSQRMQGKVAVITGAAQGIGKAITQRFASEGATPIIIDRVESAAKAAADEIAGSAEAGEAICGYRQADCMDSMSLTAAIDEIANEYGKIDVLVNNVGGATLIKPYVEMEPQEIADEYRFSLEPTLWGCRAVLPHMLKRESGVIVNIGSTSARGIYRAPYAAGKSGVVGLTTALAIELATRKIRVNCVAPAAANVTDRVTPRAGFDDASDAKAEAYLQDVRKYQDEIQVPMSRKAEVSEVAAAVAFLASDDSSFTTGHVLPVSGGAWL